MEMDWLATIRGRVGVATSDLLLYATGGFAIADVQQSIRVTAPNGNAFAGSSSDRAEGWTAGGGFEWAMSRHWRLKGEYLFVQLDPDDFQTGPAGGACTTIPNQCIFNVTTSDMQIGRAGINYRF